MKEFLKELKELCIYFFIPIMLWFIYSFVLFYLMEIENIKKWICIVLGAILAYGTYVFIDKLINPK